jgi:hypothetical protein
MTNASIDERALNIPVLIAFGIVAVCITIYGYFSQFSEIGFVLLMISVIVYVLTYSIYFIYLAPRVWSLYYWVALVIFFPHHDFPQNSMVAIGLGVEYPNMSFYLVFQTISMIPILVNIIKMNRNSLFFFPKSARIIYIGVVIMMLFGVMGSLIQMMGKEGFEKINIENTIFGIYPVLISLVVFPAAMNLINSQKCVEVIYKIILYGALMIAFELIIYKVLDISALDRWVFGNYGNFRSLLYHDNLRVGIVAILGFCLSYYFYVVSGKKRFLIYIFLLIWLLIETHVRGLLVSGAIGLIFMSYNNSSKYAKYILTIGLVIVITTISLEGLLFQYIIGERAIEGAFSLSSIFSRFGAQLRGIDVFLYEPLFGVGPGNMSTYLSTVQGIPANFYNDDLNENTMTLYRMLANNERETGTHNIYIRLLVEYGFMAIFVTFVTIFYTVRRFNKLVRVRYINMKINRKIYNSIISNYSIILAIGIYYLFQHSPLELGLYSLFLSLTYWQTQHFKNK